MAGYKPAPQFFDVTKSLKRGSRYEYHRRRR
jgi:hypothetical protein